MPVEFYCPQCDAFLRTPDSTKGKRARCPSCGDGIDVPYFSDVFEEDEFEEGEDLDFEPLTGRTSIRSELPSEVRDQGESLPWTENTESPVAHFEETETDGYVTCVVCHTVCPADSELCYECGHVLAGEVALSDEVNVGAIFRSTWAIFTQNFAVCAVVGVLDVVLFIISLIVVALPVALIGSLFQGHPMTLPVVFTLLILGLTLTTCTLWVGHTQYFMALVRGELKSPTNVVDIGKFIGRMTTATVLFFALMTCGLMMCGLPALLVITLFWPYGRYLLEHDCTAFESLRGAFELTTSNLAASSAIVVILVVVTIVGNAIPFGVFLTTPFVGVLLSVSYLSFTGERIVTT